MSKTIEDANEYVNFVTSSIDHDVLFENGSIIDAVYRGELTEAEKLCIRRIRTDQDDYYAWSFLGLVLMLKREDGKAREALDQAFLTDKTKVLALNLLGDCHYNMGDAEQGEAAYHLSLYRDGFQLHPLRNLYHHYMLNNDFEKALMIIRDALKVDSDDENTWSQIRDCMSKMGYIEAEGILLYLVHKYPHKHMPWYLKANLLLVSDKLDEAESAVRKALELNNEYALSWALLANILDASGRSEEAVECCHTSVKLEPENPYPWFCYSVILMKIGKRLESKKAASKAVALNPKKAKKILQLLSRNR